MPPSPLKDSNYFVNNGKFEAHPDIFMHRRALWGQGFVFASVRQATRKHILQISKVCNEEKSLPRIYSGHTKQIIASCQLHYAPEFCQLLLLLMMMGPKPRVWVNNSHPCCFVLMSVGYASKRANERCYTYALDR